MKKAVKSVTFVTFVTFPVKLDSYEEIDSVIIDLLSIVDVCSG